MHEFNVFLFLNGQNRISPFSAHVIVVKLSESESMLRTAQSWAST